MKPTENPEPNGHDPLEDRLRRTTFRPPAPAWRNEILSVAADVRRRSATKPHDVRLANEPGTASAATGSWAQQLVAWFRSIPTEWTAAAALWLLILAINSASSSPVSNGSTIVSVASTEARHESIQHVLAYRRQLLSDLQVADTIDDLPRAARPEADRPKRQLNFIGTNGPAATSA